MVDEQIKNIQTKQKILILVGNPNVGKSVLFGLLTGRYVAVSNYPGTTVEIASGTAQLDGHSLRVIDTPGINNLIPTSDDEHVTRNILLKDTPDIVLQVADTKNLRRALILSTQLGEMEIPFVLSLNMADEAERMHIRVDADRLSDILDISVVSTVATQGIGTDELKKELLRAHKSHFCIHFDPYIEEAIGKITALAPLNIHGIRALALLLIAEDNEVEEWFSKMTGAEKMQKIREICRGVSNRYPHPMQYIINRQRLDRIDEIVKEVYTSGTNNSQMFPQKLNYVMVHPVWGVFFLMAVLYCMYLFVGVLGAGVAVDFLKRTVFDEAINPLFTRIIGQVTPWTIVEDFLVGKYGMITMAVTYGVAIVLPIVLTFFLFLSILEDCGYLPRLATVLDRMFKFIGLNGKAIIPMVLGLGCVTMAAMTTRILETRRERILTTLLLALGIPCSAQLGVVAGMMAMLSFNAILVWLAIIVGVMAVVGYIGSKIIPGSTEDFIMELPPIRVPLFRNIIIKTIGRLEWYLKEVVPLFILGTAILFVLDELGALVKIQTAASPVVERLLGLPAQATDAFLIGFFRRDYGAAGLYDLQMQGMLDSRQTLVSMVTITLFIPCIATLFVIWKEHGWRITFGMLAIIFPLAFLVGGILNQLLVYWNLTF